MQRGGVVRAGIAAALVAGSVAVVGAPTAAPATSPATFRTRGSVEQVAVTHATPGDTVDLRDVGDTVVAHGTVDDLGSFLFRDVTPGDGYTVLEHHAGGDQVSDPVHVMTTAETPPQSFYDDQHLADGFGYITTRDQTKLSITVHLPGPASSGPYPTVVEYSGYDPSNPNAPQPSTQLAQFLGYATVGVNVRGTGCSGGAFSFFEELQSLDGYDAIETVAAQPWVAFGKPGMVGVSYPGLAQLWVARTRPPHLAAIAPLSVFADSYRSILYPGGILNDGFAVQWATERQNQAQPYGQGWERGIVDAGGPNGAQCAEDQLLRHQNQDLLGLIHSHPFREPVDLADGLAPITFVDKFDVPVLSGGAWQDEQTGGHFAPMWSNFTVSKLKLYGTNGTHVDSLIDELNRWYELIELYVAHRIPHASPTFRAAAPLIISGITGGPPVVPLEPDRFTSAPSYAAALAAYEAEPPVRIVFENGAGDPAHPGVPVGTFELHFPSWPPPQTVATTWYMQPDQQLASVPPAIPDNDGRASTSYVYDPSAKPATDFHGSADAAWAALPAWDWRPLPLGKALAFDSAPLLQPTVMVGSGSVDLWLRSTATDTDLEVTLSELRPDGREIYVQNGWLRASHRALDHARSTALQPVHTDVSADAAPLPAGELVQARVGLFPFAHVFRPGSRLRIAVEAPGGNRPFWQFADLAAPTAVVNEIAHSVGHPSRVVLPVIPGVTPPPQFPPCPSLRGEPCRPTLGMAAPTSVGVDTAPDHATVVWVPPEVRPFRPVTSYLVTEHPGGATVEVPGTAHAARFDGLADGPHWFDVLAEYAYTHESVAATPSRTVVMPGQPEPTTASTASTATTATTAHGTSPPTTAASAGGGLPLTGANAGVAFVGVALLIGGALLVGRRRRSLP